MEKLVSIILPSFNGEKTLERAINSILNQTYKQFELILIDDCSTDSTPSIIEKYAKLDDRIRTIHNNTNQKLPASLNIGFKAARGEFLTWTSDDNCYRNDAIKIMVEYLSRNKTIDMVYTDFSIVDEKGNLVEKLELGEPNTLRFGNCVGACFLYRRELANRVGGYNTDLFLVEDYDYWIRAYLNGMLYHIPQDLYIYGKHERSLTATRQEEIGRKLLELKQAYFVPLYSRCETFKDQVHFLDAIIMLVSDKELKREYKKKFYNINIRYAMYDAFRCLKKGVKDILVFRNALNYKRY